MSKSKQKTKKKAVKPPKSELRQAKGIDNQNVATKRFSSSQMTKRLILWLGSAGFLTVAFTYLIDYLGRDVRLDFSQALESGYEFVIRNEGPTDQLIKTFRLKPPDHQNIIFRTTEEIPLTQNSDGTVNLPGGNLSWIPAYEFKGLDGLVLRAKVEKKFRLPPLSSQSWAKPEAVLVDFEYVTVSQNNLLRNIEETLAFIGLHNSIHQVSFMVIDNYWTPVVPGKYKDAIDQACSERQSLAQTSICKKRRR